MTNPVSIKNIKIDNGDSILTSSVSGSIFRSYLIVLVIVLMLRLVCCW
jgi:hypothetical protein